MTPNPGMQNDFMNCPVCQSCGMPMHGPELYGRHSDGAPNDEYCIYCCPEGAEKMTGTLKEMIDCCAHIETEMGLFPDEKAAKKHLQAYLPTLRRWRND